MPISSHCFWPCESAPAVRCACSFRWIRTSVSPIRSSCVAREAKEQRRAHAAVGLERELEVLEHRQVLEHGRLLELAADADRGDLVLAQAQQVDRRAEERLAGVGPGLAGDDVHHRRLAGAVRADDAAHLAGADRERQRVERLEAVEADRDVVEVEDRAVGDVELAGARRRASSSSRGRPSGPRVAAICRSSAARRATAPARIRSGVTTRSLFLARAAAQPRDDPVRAAHEADDALRQEQRDGDEHRAERVQPELGEGLREPALRAVDEERADDRADQRRRGRRPPSRSRSRSTPPASSRSG